MGCFLCDNLSKLNYKTKFAFDKSNKRRYNPKVTTSYKNQVVCK